GRWLAGDDAQPVLRAEASRRPALLRLLPGPQSRGAPALRALADLDLARRWPCRLHPARLAAGAARVAAAATGPHGAPDRPRPARDGYQRRSFAGAGPP